MRCSKSSAACRATLILFLFLLLCPFARAGEFPSADDPGAAVGEAVRSLGLQIRLPVEREPQPSRGIHIGGSGGGAGAAVGVGANALFYVALVLLAVVVAATIYDNLPKKRASGGKEADAPDEQERAESGGRMASAREDADALAAEGRYAEAMHILLLRSLSELKLHLRVAIAQSLTSREILRRIEFDAAAHAAFADLVAAVEISYFGAHEPDAPEYEFCRSRFADLTRALRRGIAA